MPLAVGTRLGPYEVVAPLGAGGMGEVYRAKDTRLDRTVAIKILPSHLSKNTDLKQRFEREARAISKLTHPHICGLHDVGSQDGTEFLVMEFLEGETLAQRLSKGLPPTDQMLRYSIQIADALDKAHRQGIIHRDLKPGNIMVTKLGVKLLDFGLAKLLPAGFTSQLSSVSVLPTEAREITTQGTILGTIQYMAPEQLEGKEADARADIFSFGSVIYEMATGKKAFNGNSQASLMSAILKDEPLPISQVQPLSPPALDRVVKTCLAKDPEERWQNAHDLMKELAWIAEGSSQAGAVISVAPVKRHLLPWILAASLFLIAAIGWIGYYYKQSGSSQKLVQLSILPAPDTHVILAPILSPDGSKIAFTASDKSGKVNLWVRELHSNSTREVPGTEGVSNPFWSPDGRFIAFFAKGKLSKINPTTGHSQVLCDVSDERGGSWNQDGVILFSPNPGDGLYRISSSGGTITKVTSLDPDAEESSHRYPYFLPDGKHFIFFVRAHKKESGIYIGSLGSSEKSLLLASDRSAVFSSGYLLFQRSNTLFAQAFDTGKLELSGEAIPFSESVQYEAQNWGTRGMAASEDVLSYVSGSNRTQLLWFDRNGNQQGPVTSSDQYGDAPSFSPDGKKFGMQVIDGGSAQIWIYELSGGNRSRFTFDRSYNNTPCWSPDGTRIVFASDRTGLFKLYMKDAAGAGREELLYQSRNWCHPSDWSPDGRHLLFIESDSETGFDLWMLRLSDRKALPFLVTDANESNARLSPDGKWVAYNSDESGRPEIYVQPFNVEKGGKWQISTNGGFTPRWSRDSKELFYLSQDNQIMSVEINLDSSFEASAPRPLFAIHPYAIPQVAPWRDAFEPSPDGRFAVHAALSEVPPNITVVLNWQLLLTKQ